MFEIMGFLLVVINPIIMSEVNKTSQIVRLDISEEDYMNYTKRGGG